MALSIVYAPQDEATPPTVDIVAVHGLGGDAIDTWTHPKSQAFWLKDFLPKYMADARIMTFGYNAAAAFERSTAEVIDHAKSLLTSLVDKREEPEEAHRPLIFIAHSLGGIVVKQALLQARLESLYESIEAATLGLIFLGTPHRGSDKATYAKVLANIAHFVSHRPSPRLLTALETNSDMLLRLTSYFKFQLPDYQVYSFYELRPMKGLSSLIVEKHSALLEVTHEEQIPVDADHRAMCKFEMEDDPTFEKVYKRVKRMMKNPQLGTNNNPVSKNKYFDVPHLLSPAFTGRVEDFRCLTESFAVISPLQAGPQRRFVLSGLGGSGKTQICLKYIQDQRERYWGIFWVDASTDENIQRSFTQFARMLQVDENVDAVKRTLANSAESWLLVFDNADDPDLSLSPYLPAGNRGDIIITSRNPECQTYNTVGYREIGQLPLADSISLLNKTIYGTVNLSEGARDISKQIVETMGCLALAIVQAGAYIRETACPHREYLDIYQRRQKDLLLRHPTHIGTDYQYSVYTTWQVSVDMIASRQDQVGVHALRLLDLLGFYHNDQIPIQMFYNARDRRQLVLDPNDMPWHDTISDSEYRQAVQASVALLASFSLITRNADTSISLHLLVHQWCRCRQSDEEQPLNYRKALFLLACSVKWGFATEDYIFRRSLASHLQELLRAQYPESALSEVDKMLAWPVVVLILGENGRMKDAVSLTEEAVALLKSNLGEDHPDTLRSMSKLAIQYSEVGKQAEALKLAEKVVALQKSKHGVDHPGTLRSMSSLAFQYSKAGKQAEALELAKKVLALQKSIVGVDHPDTLNSMHALVFQYRDTGQEAEALKLMKEVITLQKSTLGVDHPDTLDSIQDLVFEYSEAGQEAEALKLMKELITLQKSKLGVDHPDTLWSIHTLAIQYRETGQQAEALKLIEEVMTQQKSKLGVDHPDTLDSMHTLAIQYRETGQQAEALKLADKVVALRKSKLGVDHPDTLRSERLLALLGQESKAP